MLDLVSEFKRRSRKIDNDMIVIKSTHSIEIDNSDSVMYDIYKRTVDLSINKCVAIGFQYDDAIKFIKERFKTKETERTVIFYDIVPQNTPIARDPLYNENSWVLDMFNKLKEDDNGRNETLS